jgi:hypothetical protein
VVTHLTTNPPVHCLSTAERTGSSIFSVLWSYVGDHLYRTKYNLGCVMGRAAVRDDPRYTTSTLYNQTLLPGVKDPQPDYLCNQITYISIYCIVHLLHLFSRLSLSRVRFTALSESLILSYLKLPRLHHPGAGHNTLSAAVSTPSSAVLSLYPRIHLPSIPSNDLLVHAGLLPTGVACCHLGINPTCPAVLRTAPVRPCRDRHYTSLERRARDTFRSED